MDNLNQSESVGSDAIEGALPFVHYLENTLPVEHSNYLLEWMASLINHPDHLNGNVVYTSQPQQGARILRNNGAHT
jgi:hypothetical protein